MIAEDIWAELDRFLEASAAARKAAELAPLETRLAQALRRAWRKEGKALDRELAARPMGEAGGPGIGRAELDRRYARAHDRVRTQFTAPLESVTRDALGRGGRAGAAQLGSAFSLDNARAVAYLRGRGADRVTAISEETRNQLRELLSEATARGASYRELAKDIRNMFEGFGGYRRQAHIADRAELVAVTETGDAYSEGQRQTARELASSGTTVEKRWLEAGDEKVCPICEGNGADDWIGIDEPYSSGAMRPLGHPACRCDEAYRTVAVQGDGTDATGFDAFGGTEYRRIRRELAKRGIVGTPMSLYRGGQMPEDLRARMADLLAKHGKEILPPIGTPPPPVVPPLPPVVTPPLAFNPYETTEYRRIRKETQRLGIGSPMQAYRADLMPPDLRARFEALLGGSVPPPVRVRRIAPLLPKVPPPEPVTPPNDPAKWRERLVQTDKPSEYGRPALRPDMGMRFPSGASATNPLDVAFGGKPITNETAYRMSSARTTKELSEWAARIFKDLRSQIPVFPMRGMAIEIGVPTLREMDSLARMFPGVMRRMVEYGTGGGGAGARFGRGVWAQVTYAGSSMHYNPAVFKDAARLASELRSSTYAVGREDVHLIGRSFHPTGADTFAHVTTHEFGHILDYWLDRQMTTLGSTGRTIDSAWNALKRELEQPSMRSEVSGYASGKDGREVIAEAFAELRWTPREQWSLGAKKLHEFLDMLQRETKGQVFL